METAFPLNYYFAYYRFLAKNHLSGSTEQLREIHFHTVMVLSTGILMWAYALVAMIFIESPIPGIVGFAAALIHSLSPLLFRTKLSTFTICNIAIGAGCAHQSTFSYFTNGYHSPILIWLAILPLLAGIIAGSAGAILWAIITLTDLSIFAYLHYTGHQFPQEISPLGFEWAMSLILFGFVILNTTMILIYTNIRRKTEITLEKQSEKIDTLFRILFHDLANSLGRLNFGITLLSRQDGADKLQRGINMAREATNTMLDITQNVKSMYAVSKGKTSVELCPTSILETLAYIQRAFSEEIKKKNIMIATHIVGAADIDVYVDPVSFKNQVMGNIISNAIKFSPPGGTIFVTAQRLGEWVEIKVVDNGIGMPEHIVKNIFEINYKTSRLGTSGEIGTGFGMIIMKNFMDLFGGNVTVESVEDNSLGKNGTTFTLGFRSRFQ